MTTLVGSMENLQPNCYDLQPFGHEVVEASSSGRDEAISDLRHFLVGLTTDVDHGVEVGRVNCVYGLFKEYTGSAFWTEGDEPLQALAGASDNTLRDFTHTNYNYYQCLQAALAVSLPKVDVAVKEAAERLHLKGHLPEQDAVLIGNVISEIPAPRAIDPFDAAYEGILGFCSERAAIGLYLQTANRLDISSLTHTRFHELAHAAGAYYGKGFIWRNPSSRLLEEVAVSSLTSRAFDESDEFDTALRPTVSYAKETEFLELLLNTEQNFRNMLRVMYAPALSPLRSNLARELDDRTRLALPFIQNGWSEINDSYESSNKQQTRESYVKDLIAGAWRKRGIEILSEDEEPSDELAIK